MPQKFFTIVIRANDEAEARKLVPGTKIGSNEIVGCSLGDAISLNDKFKELIPAVKEDELAKIEHEDMAAFLRG